MRARVVWLLACAIVNAAPGARAETAAGIVERLRAMVEPVHDRSMRVTVHLQHGSGEEDVRSLRGFEKKTADGWKVLWVFDSPSDLTGTGFLAWIRRSQPDLLWAYFPAQARVRQLPKPGEQTRFQGSDFSYADLRLLAFDYEAEHRLEGEAACGDARCYVLETTLPAGAFPYSRLRSWLRIDTLVPARVEFLGENVQKVMEVLRSGRVDGIPTVLAFEMETPSQAHRTLVECDRVSYNTGLEESFFSTERLSRMER
jgi:Outer membrane lipoprotein-sorting protein